MAAEDVVGPVRVAPAGYPGSIDTFICAGTFNAKSKKFSAAPKLEAPEGLEPVEDKAKALAKGERLSGGGGGPGGGAEAAAGFVYCRQQDSCVWLESWPDG